MNVLSQLRAVRVVLTVGAVLRALAWGAGAAFSLVLGAALVDLAVPLTLDTRNAILVLGILAAVAVSAALIWRDRSVLSLTRVALWIEEHFPSLEYALVTAVETGDGAFVARASTERWRPTALRRAVRALRTPVAVAAIATIVLLVLPAGAVARIRAPHAGDSLERGRAGGGPNASRLTPLAADVCSAGVQRRAIENSR